MFTPSTMLTAIVGLIHVMIAIAELFFWRLPLVHGRIDFPAEAVLVAEPIVQNAGLYNGFIAAGLLWSAFTQNRPNRVFFLSCVVIAGVVGAVTLRPTTLVLQTVPALIALAVVWRSEK